MAEENLQHKNPLLDKALVNAFVNGVKKTLSKMASTEVVCEKPFIQNDFQMAGNIAGIIGMVASPLTGTLMLSFTEDSIFLILKNMLNENFTEINDSVADAVGELANMIYGSAKTTLNNVGYNFEMAIPTIVRGDFIIAKSQSTVTLVVPFTLENKSKMFIVVAIQ
jgi:chemotaxis protein CheX